MPQKRSPSFDSQTENIEDPEFDIDYPEFDVEDPESDIEDDFSSWADCEAITQILKSPSPTAVAAIT